MTEDKLIDALNELDVVSSEASKLKKTAATLTQSPAWTDDEMRWLLVSGLASAIDKIYSGCERSLEIIARDIDKKRIEKSDGWHRELLLRMSRPYPGVRAAVLSEATYRVLDHLRSFRHRQRNSYVSDLDADIVVELANEVITLPELLRLDIAELGKTCI